jgi:8-oxo-dGTP pyrophosphatase MutT (NUDIX family)
MNKPLADALLRHTAFDDVECTHLLHAQHALRTLEEPFLRTTFTPGHFTGAGWITTPTFSHVLLLWHPVRNLWMQPGGHADGDPDLCRVAAKEVAEETGLAVGKDLVIWQNGALFDVDTHYVPARAAHGARQAEPGHLHYDMRYLFIAPKQLACTSPEGLELVWQPVTWCLANFPPSGGRYRCCHKLTVLAAGAEAI